MQIGRPHDVAGEMKHEMRSHLAHQSHDSLGLAKVLSPMSSLPSDSSGRLLTVWISAPACLRRITKALPMKPRPPVTKTARPSKASRSPPTESSESSLNDIVIRHC